MSIITNFNINIENKEKIEEKEVTPVSKVTFDKLICECDCSTEEISEADIKSLFEENNGK